MLTHWTFAGCDQRDERQIAQAWEERQQALESKLAELDVEPSELRLGAYYDDAGPLWEIQAALHLSRGTVVVEETAESVEIALDRVLRGLLRKIDRRQEAPERIGLEWRGLNAVAALLERNRAAGRSDAFFSFLWPVMRTLRTMARRELEMHELEGEMHAEQLTSADILDEAMLRAWERYDRRPADQPLEAWLSDLVRESLQDLIRGNGHESLDDVRPLSALPAGDESWEELWSDLMDLPEAEFQGEVLPGALAADVWDDPDVDEKQTGLAALLRDLPRQSRQALVYYVVEGREPTEIADLQDRPVEEVSADIRSAWQALAHGSLINGDLSGAESSFERDRRNRGNSRKRRR